MVLDMGDEILHDFLIEAGEILESLSSQLVDLENSPTDTELLNAIFRGFHTIKGGAGFLSLLNLVNICHECESVFDILRTGKINVDPNLMDIILKSVDVVNVMFASIKQGVEPQPCDQLLLDSLKYYADPTTISKPAIKAEEVLVKQQEPAIAVAEIAQHNSSTQNKPLIDASNSDLITEQEFDELLDKLNNSKDTKNISPALVVSEAVGSVQNTQKPFVEVQAEKVSTNSGATALEQDLITEAEFDDLLDSLAKQNKGKATSTAPIEQSTTLARDPSQVAADKAVTATTKPANHLATTTVNKTSATNNAPVAPASLQKTQQTRISSESASAIMPIEKETKSPEPTKTDLATKKDPKSSTSNMETTVRVDTDKLDQIMNMVGELVLVRNRLVKLKSVCNNPEIIKSVGVLNLVTADLQISVMKTRMQPIKKVFGRFPRVVRDLARSLGKEIVLEMVGEETDLDKNLVDALADPLVHLVRNSVDHGIEMPPDRKKANKAPAGKIILSAAQAGDHIVLTIEDDGKGMDPDELRNSAVAKGIVSKDVAARLNANECFDLIFIPGFSTKQEISDISGRGVGMDVVKTKISQLNGTIEIFSTKGQGSKIVIKVPLTLAILPTLMVVVGEQPFALPLTAVNEIFDLNLEHTNIVDGQLVVLVRGKPMPLFYLKDMLVQAAPKHELTSIQHVVVVSVSMQKIGLVVDKLLGQEEVVIKALGTLLHGTKGIAGATITGDGNIAMILDVPNLLKRHTESLQQKTVYA